MTIFNNSFIQFIASYELKPAKARILLMLAILKEHRFQQVQDLFLLTFSRWPYPNLYGHPVPQDIQGESLGSILGAGANKSVFPGAGD